MNAAATVGDWRLNRHLAGRVRAFYRGIDCNVATIAPVQCGESRRAFSLMSVREKKRAARGGPPSDGLPRQNFTLASK
ncbi:MAG TPA: hypothetical protein VFQ95_06240 [Rhodanobacteraceae bacterium]|nr:hypothetical protein [Rhodanobacteraceae bacterium]